MTADEIRAYLSARTHIVLVTNGQNGLPHPVPMHYGLDAEGRILITSFRKSQKIKNLERDPRAALLVESGQTYAELKGVIIYANAEIIVDPEAVALAMRHVRAATEMAESITTGMDDQIRASMQKRVVVRFTPFRFVSWDHAKLGEFY
jgi:PPOX class probable F420-dependent enzyme